jgi:hypothetical protein
VPRRPTPRKLVSRAGLGLWPRWKWLHERDIAVYSGDCVERLPITEPLRELPLHQIGIAAMGLVVLDWPSLTEMVTACARYQRTRFLLTVAPLAFPGATGSSVNPIATF